MRDERAGLTLSDGSVVWDGDGTRCEATFSEDGRTLTAHRLRRVPSMDVTLRRVANPDKDAPLQCQRRPELEAEPKTRILAIERQEIWPERPRRTKPVPRRHASLGGSDGGLVETLYEHAGGDEGLHRLEQRFYERALADPVLKAVFRERVDGHVDHLTWFTAESFGGPCRFSRELGFSHLIDVHRHLEITDEQRDRFVAVYLEVLDEVGMPEDAPFREAVREHVEFGADVARQNSRAKTDAELNPIREVPRWQWHPEPY